MAAERVGASKCEITLGSGKVEIDDVIQFTVDKDLNQPDMAVAVLKNVTHRYVAQAKIGDPFQIKSTSATDDSLRPVFVGEIAGIEPQYKGEGESRVVIRGFCKLHKKLQGKKHDTFQDKNDQQILQKVLEFDEFEGPDEAPTYKHVTQDMMTDLDFARMRVARMGCYIWNENGKIVVKKPKFEDSGIVFKIFDQQTGAHRMKSFNPRLTAAQIIKSHEVRGWDPEKKEAIVQRVSAEPSKLGNTEASAASGSKAAEVNFTSDQPAFSNEEAKMIAKAKIQEHNLGYMSAEAEAFGNPDYLPGKVISIFVNSQASDKFDGKYFVTGVTHKYSHGTQNSPTGGYTTVFRLARNAEVG